LERDEGATLDPSERRDVVELQVVRVRERLMEVRSTEEGLPRDRTTGARADDRGEEPSARAREEAVESDEPNGDDRVAPQEERHAGEDAHRDAAGETEVLLVLERQPEDGVDDQRERTDLHPPEGPEDERVVEEGGDEHAEGHPGRGRDLARDLRRDE